MHYTHQMSSDLIKTERMCEKPQASVQAIQPSSFRALCSFLSLHIDLESHMLLNAIKIDQSVYCCVLCAIVELISEEKIDDYELKCVNKCDNSAREKWQQHMQYK